ncbi:hypothetical protein BGZ70_002105 [Mortierella alpina]|uniref:PX domain-containing protein n=1 Tax=Mortierella alpina TaxID=64518 RepID=A0A9P6JEP0_MORAP|nr:hypothetical protein BGZ70_002105 [Mortierella alpina]
MKSLRISIPEAASSGGTITFKILVATATSESTYPVFRTFPQVRWLHHKLQTTFVDYVVPPLPESLSEKLSEDVDQVEQKRVQIERFLQRVCLRQEFATSEAVLWFVGTEMTHLDSVDSKRATLGFLRFDNIIKPSYDRGMRVYRPTENVEENDQGEFQRRQVYLLAMEQSFTGLLDAGLRLTKEREKLGDAYSQLGDATMEVLSSKHRLGDGQRIDNRERHQALDDEMQVFGVLTDDMRLSIRRQVKAETFQFMGMIQEYKSMLQGLKDVMNLRTDRLSEYVSASKRVTKKQAQVEQAVQKMATAPAADLEFKKSQVVVTRELLRYEKDKAKEWQSSVQDYASKQMMYEKEKLEALERAWDSIRDLRTSTEGMPSGGDAGAARGMSSERSRSYWPSGLGSPYAPELEHQDRKEDLIKTEPVTRANTLQTGPEVNLEQERLPQNAGFGGGHNSGYNSSGHNSGYNSGDQDEGQRVEPGYFPSTKLSRSGSGARSQAAGSGPGSTTNSRKGSAAGLAAGGSSGAPLQPLSSSAVGPGEEPADAGETLPKTDVLSAEREGKSMDGYDPLMVRPGFSD